MSTKTSFKRIALVAVAALGFGVLSVVPSNADTAADTMTASAATTSTTVNVATKIYVTQTFLGQEAASSWVKATAYVVSAPAYSVALPTWTALTPDSATALGYSQVNATNTATDPSMQVAKTSTSAAGYVQATNKLSFTPTIPGTYVIKLVATNNTGGASNPAGAQAAAITWTVTAVGTAPANPTYSKLWLWQGDAAVGDKYGYFYGLSTCNASLATVEACMSADAAGPITVAINPNGSTIGSIVGTIFVSERNNFVSGNTDLSTAGASPINVKISGHGYVAVKSVGTVSASAIIYGTDITESAVTSNGNDGYQSTGKSVLIKSDGTTGTATVTISNGGVVLGTKTIIFYGTAATATGSANSNTVANTGVGTDNEAAEIQIADATGNPVMGLASSIVGVSSDTSVLNSFIAGAGGCYDDSTPSALAYVGAPGAYTCDVTGVAGAASGKSATMTFKIYSGATLLAASAPVKFTLGGTVISSLAVTLDKTDYLPGDRAVLTLTARDSSGNAIADGAYHVFNKSNATTSAYAGMSTSAAITSTIFAAAACRQNTVVGTCDDSTATGYPAGAIYFVDGVATTKFYMPYADTTFVVSGTTSGSSADLSTALKALGYGTALKVSATVSTAATAVSQAAADAAAEATDAANAATDAANAAAEAADAATAAAQDAADAVAALSAQVADLISGLKAQLTALTNLVIKIQKKVKA